MKRVLILCLFLYLSTTAGKCATTLFPPLQPIITNQANNPTDYNNNLTNNVTSLADPYANSQSPNYSDISKIENSLFGQTYSNQNITIRLSRIEKNLFSTTYPNSTTSQRIENVILNFNQINKYPNISQSVLSRIESKVFNQNFPQNSAKRRIERLEEKMFGAIQSGDLDSRYDTLKVAAKNYNNFNKEAYNPNVYNPAPIQRGWKGLGGMLGGGTMTGFTPPITPFYNNYGYNSSTYDTGYGYNPYTGIGIGGNGIYRGTRTNTGYSDNFQDFSSGAGVTILD